MTVQKRIKKENGKPYQVAFYPDQVALDWWNSIPQGQRNDALVALIHRHIGISRASAKIEIENLRTALDTARRLKQQSVDYNKSGDFVDAGELVETLEYLQKCVFTLALIIDTK